VPSVSKRRRGKFRPWVTPSFWDGGRGAREFAADANKRGEGTEEVSKVANPKSVEIMDGDAVDTSPVGFPGVGLDSFGLEIGSLHRIEFFAFHLRAAF
jgi:hypothetical protein